MFAAMIKSSLKCTCVLAADVKSRHLLYRQFCLSFLMTFKSESFTTIFVKVTLLPQKLEVKVVFQNT